MAETYPSSLPCFLRGGSITRPDNLINHSMSNGEIFGRKRFTNTTPRIQTVSLYLDAAGLLIWENFVTVTLGDGKNTFDAPIVTWNTNNQFTAGKPTNLTEVYLFSTAYTIKERHADSWVIENIRLRLV